MIDKISEAFHFSKNEAKVFLTIVEVRTATVSEIARRSDIPRNTARGLLDKLTSLGLLIKTKSGIMQIYTLESVDNILQTLELQKKSYLEDLEIQREAVSTLSSTIWKDTSGKKPKLTLYEGHRGLIKVYEDSLTAKEQIVSWASFDANDQALPNYFKTYYQRRSSKKISIRSIHPATKLALKHIPLNKQHLRTARYVPEKYFNVIPEIQIYNNKVSITSWREKIALLIESEEIASALKAIFELSWKGTQFYKIKK